MFHSPTRFHLILVSLAGAALSVLPALAESQARIVRLSDVQGSVQIDKNTGLGFENAFVNLPITQDTQLRTRDNGRAEVEFEDGSTLRLAPNSTIQFSALGNSDAGKHLSTIDIVDGMAYVNWLGKSGDQINLNFSHEKISLERPAHFRVSTSPDQSRLAVFKGDVAADGPSGNVTVEKNKTATFDGTDDKSTMANKVASEPLDSWDKDSISYHNEYSKNTSSPFQYGYSDLNYYGNYTNVPGYGMMWQPFFTGVGWDPFMDGAWSFYPGYGYMFVSAYPWGWLPYRYGNWMFMPAYGWMWQPGGWNTWTAIPHYTAPPASVHMTSLVAPTTGTVKTVNVGRSIVLSPSSTMASRIMIHSGSAGLGIPRGSISSLNHLNSQVTKNGFVQVHSAPQFATSSPSMGFGGPRSSSASSAPMAHASSSSSMGGHASGGGGGSHH
jgi:hypothetical protein